MIPYKYNTISPRITASFIDQCFLGLLYKLLDSLPNTDYYYLNILSSILYFNIPFVYNIVMLGSYGQTIGKGLMRLKVIDFVSNGKMNYSQAIYRELIPLVLGNTVMIFLLVGFSDIDREYYQFSFIGWLVVLFPLILSVLWVLTEIITMSIDNKCRALHDKIADTVVVRTDSKL